MSDRLAITIVGATGSGKSHWAREIAELFEAGGKRASILDDADRMDADERQRRVAAAAGDVVIYTRSAARQIPRPIVQQLTAQLTVAIQEQAEGVGLYVDESFDDGHLIIDGDLNIAALAGAVMELLEQAGAVQ